MKKGFKFTHCRNGHPYSTFGFIRQNGRWKGMQRCCLCWKDNNFRNNRKVKKIKDKSNTYALSIQEAETGR